MMMENTMTQTTKVISCVPDAVPFYEDNSVHRQLDILHRIF